MKKLFLLPLFLLIVSCATQVERVYETASGSAEITINTSKEEIINYLVNDFVNSGYSIVNQSNNLLSMERELQNSEKVFVALTVGNSYSNNTRLSNFNFIDTPEGVRVIWKQYWKAVMPFGQVNQEEITNNEVFNYMINELRIMKIRLEP